MSQTGQDQTDGAASRAYCVHCSDETPPNTHRVEAKSFSEAALTFLECWHVAAHGDEVQVIVEQADSGERHCFTVDLASGDASPCD